MRASTEWAILHQRLMLSRSDTILAGGESNELVVKLRRTAPIDCPTPPPTHYPAPPPKSCLWSYDGALSGRASDAARPGTTWDGLDPHGERPEQRHKRTGRGAPGLIASDGARANG